MLKFMGARSLTFGKRNCKYGKGEAGIKVELEDLIVKTQGFQNI